MKNREKRNWTMKNKFSLWMVIVGAALFMSASTDDAFETSKQLEVFTAVLKQVQTSYVEDVGANKQLDLPSKECSKNWTVYRLLSWRSNWRCTIAANGRIRWYWLYNTKDRELSISPNSTKLVPQKSGDSGGDILKKVDDTKIEDFLFPKWVPYWKEHQIVRSVWW